MKKQSAIGLITLTAYRNCRQGLCSFIPHSLLVVTYSYQLGFCTRFTLISISDWGMGMY